MIQNTLCFEEGQSLPLYDSVTGSVTSAYLFATALLCSAYAVRELVEARTRHGATIFCTQFEPAGLYFRIDPDPESDSPICEAIMDRVIHNAYEILVDGQQSMRERHGLKAEVLS